MKTVVCDAGPIIHLHEAGLIGMLRGCGSVYLPRMVHDEISKHSSLATIWPPWIKIVSLNIEQSRRARFWTRMGDLDAGEAEAIVLAEAMDADWLLTDDAAARLFSSSLGMEVHGSLGVVLWNVAHARIGRRDGLLALQKLRRTSLWLSTQIYQEARAAILDMTPND